MRRVLCPGVAAILCAAVPALAGYPDLVGTRPIGMGGALRAAATGDAALGLNPSGMSLVRSYAIEGSYQYARPGSANRAHVSIVDSTSTFNLSGGVYYTYHNLAAPTAMPMSMPMSGKRTGHEAGIALSFPIGDRVFVGALGKYLRLGDDPATAGNDPLRDFNVDVGVTVRPANKLSVAAVGYNLNDLKRPDLPLALGLGAALSVLPDFMLTFDALVDFTTSDPNRGTALGLMGGGEYVFDKRFAVRAGGGREALSGNGYIAGGLSALSEVGAADVGMRQDIAGQTRATVVGVSLRLFIQSP